jgi:diacylglycerol kinase (ATP)
VSAVLAAGGDGTLHLAMQVVAGTATPLGVIPLGTGNDTAAAWGVPRDPQTALAEVVAGLRTGVVSRLDAAHATTARGERRWWASVLCMGFDASVADRANKMRWLRGRLRYDAAVAAELWRLTPTHFALTVDGRLTLEPATLIAVGNTRSYGGGLPICPGADPQDGLLDVTVVGPLSRSALVWARPQLVEGSHVLRREVQTFRAQRLEATVAVTAGGVKVSADGETLPALPLTLESAPGALAVLGIGSGPPQRRDAPR